MHKSSNKLLEITTHSVMDRKLVAMNPTPAAKKSKKAADIQRAINYIEKGYKVLIILRGLPGSGKSYLARQILLSTLGEDGVNVRNHILSSDDYFCQNPQNLYIYDPRFIEEAHNWNQQRAFESMSRGYSPVFIDNTNTQMWEMKPYATMATDYGYIIEILEPETHWCFNDKELTKRNQHGVPKSKINDMLGRYEKNVTPQKLLSAYNLSYRLQKPPQLRLYPPPNVSRNSLNNSLKSVNISPNRNMYRNKPTYDFLGTNETVQNEKIIDTIDLMDFNDDHFPNQSEAVVQNKPQTSGAASNSRNISQYSSTYSIFDGVQSGNPVDDILMCTNDSNPSTNTNILLPQLNANMEIISIDSSDDENSTKVEKAKPIDIESSWGVNEDILKSWDIVTPLEDIGNATLPVQSEIIKKPETKDACCITEDECFMLLKNRESNIEFLKIIETVNRDINRSTPASPKNLPIPKKVMLEKSCMTEDIYEDYENHMSELMNLFPTIPKSNLSYWYNKCKGDLEWTIEFLLEAKDELDTLYEDENMSNENKSDSSEILEVESINPGPSTSATSKNKKFRKSIDQDSELKKLIESKVDIDDKYYSKHVLKVKNFKFNKGKVDSEQISQNSEPNSSNSSPSIENKHIEEEIVDDSDMEFDDTDNDDSAKSDLSSDETIELNLGDYFVSQLEKEFGDPNVEYPKGFQPVVQVPVSLARQLYAFYMESVYQQMENQRVILDTLTKEDEEFAKRLQAKEQEAANPPQSAPVMNLKEIMDEQVAQSIYEKETSLWRNLDPDNLAARLTRQKLSSTFPNIDEGTLVEILHAHGNKYDETVESLLASTGMTNTIGNVEKLKEPPIKETVLEEMKEAKRNNVVEVNNNIFC